MNLRLIAIVSGILGLILAIDGIYLVVIKYNDGETQAFNLPDGWMIIISAAILLIVSIIAFVMSRRTRQTETETQS